MNNNDVIFTPAKLIEFEKVYKSTPKKVFIFEGQKYLKEYAKYLIEFLDERFGTNEK